MCAYASIVRNMKFLNIDCNKRMNIHTRTKCVFRGIFTSDNTPFFSRPMAVRFFVIDGTSADSFHDVDKTADEEFLFPCMSRDERKCRRAAIDPARAAPAPNADQSAIHYHLRELQFLRCTNSAAEAMHIKLGESIHGASKRLSLVQIMVILIRKY